MAVSIYCVALLALIGCVYVAASPAYLKDSDIQTDEVAVNVTGARTKRCSHNCITIIRGDGNTVNHGRGRPGDTPNCGAQGGGGGCDKNSPWPCCSKHGFCGSTAEHCKCKGCKDYRRG